MSFQPERSNLSLFLRNPFTTILSGIQDYEAKVRSYELDVPQIDEMADIYHDVLSQFQSDDFLENETKKNPIILHSFDSKFDYIFLPNTVKLNWQAATFLELISNRNGIKVLRYPLDFSQENRREKYIYQRRIYGGTAWSYDESEGGFLWNLISDPYVISVNDPTVPDNKKRRIIQNITVGPIFSPSWLDHREDRPKFFYESMNPADFFRKRVEHELGHIDEMNVRPWKNRTDDAFPKAENVEEYEKLLQRVLGNENVRSIINLHSPYKTRANLPRGYIGELYAYFIEMYFIYKNKENEVFDFERRSFDFSSILAHMTLFESIASVERMNNIRDKNTYPVIDKNKYAIIVIDEFIHRGKVNTSDEIKDFLIAIKNLMRN